MALKIGLCVPNYGKATGKKALDVFAELAEKLDYDSIWTTDHLLIPKQFSSPYGTTLESISTLAYLAGKTKRVKLGTSIIVFPMREVVLFAKQASAVQILSDNRLELGLGAGWNQEEFKNVRAEFESRGRYYDEGLQLFRWLMKGNNDFKGDSYSITDGVFDPVPKKEIPLLIGGNGGSALRRAAKLGDGWFPVGVTPEEVTRGKQKIRTMTDRKLQIVVRLSVEFSKQKGSLDTIGKGARGDVQSRLAGTSDEILTQLASFRKAGVDGIVCYFGDNDLRSLKLNATKFAKEVIMLL